MDKKCEKYKVLSAVVTYKSRKYVEVCLKALTNQTYASHKILVIDNASGDNIDEIVREFKGVELIKNEKNSGYAFAVNQGLEKALQDEAEFAFILNPDVDMDSQVLEKLVMAAQQNREIGAIGPRIVQMDASTIPDRDNSSLEKDNVNVNWLTGCGILIRLEAVRQIGLFDPAYFLYFEETDFLYRLRKRNWKIVRVNSAILKHLGAGSTQYIRTKAYYYLIRNIFVFAKKNMPDEDYAKTAKFIASNLWNIFYFPMHPLRLISYTSGIFVGISILLFSRNIDSISN